MMTLLHIATEEPRKATGLFSYRVNSQRLLELNVKKKSLGTFAESVRARVNWCGGWGLNPRSPAATGFIKLVHRRRFPKPVSFGQTRTPPQHWASGVETVVSFIFV